jgi:DNA-binding transcriptional regulator YdaS (Cro superfamily)
MFIDFLQSACHDRRMKKLTENKSIEALAISLVNVKKIAATLGVTPNAIYIIAKRGKHFSPACASLMAANANHWRVTRQALRPDDWRLIWPELAKGKK